jgi:NCS1 family nucleobase:cation symporter-1
MIIGVLYAPWTWFQNAGTIFEALGMIGGLLGPVTGIMLTDYFYTHRQSYDVEKLYKLQPELGKLGINYAGVGAMFVGGGLSIIGFFFEPLKIISEFSWFVGVFSGAILYFAFDKICLSLSRRKLTIPESGYVS